MYHLRLIVEAGEVEDESLQIALEDAQKLEPDYAVGEDCIQQVFLDDFGRRSILNARQALMSRIIELEKDELFKNTKTNAVKSSPVKYTMFGNVKLWYSTMTAMNCLFRKTT